MHKTIKKLIIEKLEDLRDIGYVKRLKESKPSNYFSADQITGMFEK